MICIQTCSATDENQKKDLNCLDTFSRHIALAMERKDFEEKLQARQQVLENVLKNTTAKIAEFVEKDLIQKEKMEKERLQGVLEMAGAICHEMNQPLQTIMGYADLLAASKTDVPREIDQIKRQADRIGKITRRLSSITRYKTILYPGNKQIIDIWGASTDDEDDTKNF